MKKLLSAILALTMVFTLIPLGVVTASAETLSGTTGDCTWTLVDGVLTISGNGAMVDYSTFASGEPYSSAPWGEKGWNTIKTIEIQEGITYIGENAFFSFGRLETVFLPKSIQEIGCSAFDGWQDWENGYFYMDDLKDVYYTGSISDRFKIDIASGNDALLNATWHYAVDEHQTVTLFKNSDGKWYYYPDGQKSTVTTLTNHKGKWFYVENGVWNTQYTGLFKYKDKWLYIENGKWNSTAETLTKYNGKWFYIKGGKWDKTATKFFKYNGKTFYIKNGKWDNALTALAKYNGKLRYIKNGKLNKATTFFEYKDKLYYIKNGIAYSNFSGKITFKDGKLKSFVLS